MYIYTYTHTESKDKTQKKFSSKVKAQHKSHPLKIFRNKYGSQSHKSCMLN